MDNEKNEVTLPVSTFIVMGVIALIILGTAIVVTAAVNQETQDLGKCIVHQMAEHREENREVQEALAGQHNDFTERVTEIPQGSKIIPEPKDENLQKFCDPYLENHN